MGTGIRSDPVHAKYHESLQQEFTARSANVRTTVGLSANGHVLAVRRSVQHDDSFWNVASPTDPTPIGSMIRADEVAFSAGSDQMAAMSPHSSWTQLYNIGGATPKPEGRVRGTLLALSVDGHIVAVQPGGALSQQVQFWNMTNPFEPIRLQTMSADAIAFGPDHQLATGSGNGTIRIWSMADPTRLTPIGEVFSGDSSPIDTLVFSRNGTLLVSGSVNGQIYLWDLRVGDAIGRICADTWPLTPMQSQLYAPGISGPDGCL
jgi:WD40 repeat protein